MLSRPRRLGVSALALLAAGLVAACAIVEEPLAGLEQVQRPEATPPASATAEAATPLPTAPAEQSGEAEVQSEQPASTTTPAPDGPTVLPLEDLAPAAAERVAAHGAAGVAVYLPGRDVMYAANGQTPFPMASLVKIPIMLATLDRAAVEERELTEEERVLLENMITVSDNNAATALWERLGGGAGLGAYLRSIGVEGIGPVSDGEWGDTGATAVGVARLLAAMFSGDVVAEGQRDYAAGLLRQIVDQQRWGVSAGAEDEGDGTPVLLKNGWYPADDGWWMNSAGVVVDDQGEMRYALVVLSKEHPSEFEGIAFVEDVARAIHEALAATAAPPFAPPPAMLAP